MENIQYSWIALIDITWKSFLLAVMCLWYTKYDKTKEIE